MQLLRWMTPNRPELWFLAGATTYSPSSFLYSVPRRKMRRGSFFFTSRDSFAITDGRSKCAYPCILRSAGRMIISKPTYAAAGLPGRPNTGVPRTMPNVWALPGRMFTVVISSSPNSDTTDLMKSKSPFDAPPLVTTKSYASAAADTAAASASFVSSTMGRMTGTAPAACAQAASA